MQVDALEGSERRAKEDFRKKGRERGGGGKKKKGKSDKTHLYEA